VNTQTHKHIHIYIYIMSDWDAVTVVGRKAKVGGTGPRENVIKTAGQINAARRTGAITSVDKKYGIGNSKSDPEGQRLTKIDRADDIVVPKKIEASVGKAIQKGRQDKGLSQKDLATKINEKPTVVNDYEAGRGTPNQQILAKMERALGVKLRGKDIGTSLFKKK
jgi:putative transcription factor